MLSYFHRSESLDITWLLTSGAIEWDAENWEDLVFMKKEWVEFATIDPSSGVYCKRGYHRADGLIFVYRQKHYRPSLRKHGYYETWGTLDDIEAQRTRDREARRKLRNESRAKLKDAPKRINPLTGTTFIRWDLNDDGSKYFWTYSIQDSSQHEGYKAEIWRGVENRLKDYCMITRHAMAKRAKKDGLPFDISLDELIDLFPEDGKCPVLGMKMNIGGKPQDPANASVDKLVPSLGYVKDNVVWMSLRANTIKTDATHDEINRLKNWLDRLKRFKDGPVRPR